MNCDMMFHGRVRVEIDVTVEERTKERGENKSVSKTCKRSHEFYLPYGKPRRPKGHVVGSS